MGQKSNNTLRVYEGQMSLRNPKYLHLSVSILDLAYIHLINQFYLNMYMLHISPLARKRIPHSQQAVRTSARAKSAPVQLP